MRLTIHLAVLCAGALSFVVNTDREHISGIDLVNYVNSVQNLFVAEENGMTEEEMKAKVMESSFTLGNFSEYQNVEVKSDVNAAIPDSFDVRNRWGACKTTKIIRDQRSCGSCWAFSSAEVMSDRICIRTNGRSQPEISPEDIVTCVERNGCSGGWPLYAFQYWSKNGFVTGGDYGQGGCKPYSIGPCTQAPCTSPKAPACSASCKAGYPVAFVNDKHYGISSYSIARQASAIQTEIMTNGPVVAVYSVYADFYKYRSGIYKHTAGAFMGLHAVKILGWGTENGTPYWIVANSWGNTWGEAGFFRMYRGTNECGIEDQVVAGLSREV